jgi:glycerate dehydrogenase
MDCCPNLKYLGVLATGYNNIDISYAQEKHIAVTNVPSYSTASVAQLTFSLLFEIANSVSLHDAAVRNGDWQRSADFCFTVKEQTELAGRTIGVIGYGSIGRQVAKIADAIGMDVLVYTPHPPKSEDMLHPHQEEETSWKTENIKFVSLDTLFAYSDVISLHCPLTPENKGFINKDTIRRMKDGVILLNTARGPLIAESDLAAALKSGKVGAAGIDVLATEPPGRDNPLIGAENCIVTPHIAWLTKAARMRVMEISYRNLEAFVKEESCNRIV